MIMHLFIISFLFNYSYKKISAIRKLSFRATFLTLSFLPIGQFICSKQKAIIDFSLGHPVNIVAALCTSSLMEQI